MRRRSSRSIMLTAAACLLPGLLVTGWLVDPLGVLLNTATALIVAILTEWGCSRARRPAEPVARTDPGALVTALIIAAALPPGAIAAVAGAVFVALSLGKHAYGGLGNNVFNPAMVGYAVVLVSFPAAVADWPLAVAGSAVDAAGIDGLTGATALTAFKYRGAATVADVWIPANGFGALGSLGHEWAAAAFLLGGLLLMSLRMAAWRPCAGMLGTMVALGVAGYDNGSSASLGSPLYHLFSGGTLLAAGFVVTDPVTHPAGHRDQWLFGALVGALAWLIRAWGNYPDGIAFAVLLANALVPYLDRRTALGGEAAHG